MLFLIVLLFTAPLISFKNKWTKTGTTKYSLLRLIKIVTAFTIGHSLTLLIAASGIFKLPQQPVEILIAFSILVTALHAIRPIFPNKEIYFAAGFGLIHGLAFAAVLSNLNLETGRMIISVLGFNIGIELMQLFVVLLIFPWILILSTTTTYKLFRIVCSFVSVIVSIAWIIERILQKPNVVSGMVQKTADNGKYFVLVLAIFTLLNTLYLKVSNRIRIIK